LTLIHLGPYNSTLIRSLCSGNFGNRQTPDLTPVEEAEGLQALMTEQKYTQEQLGGIIGKDAARRYGSTSTA
jgi:hypothetical protein